MSTEYSDISSAQAGMSLAGVPFVCIKSTEGTYYHNPDYERARDDAWEHHGWVTAYHWLRNGNGAAQAEYCAQRTGINRNGPAFMLDVELYPNDTYPAPKDVADFVTEFRKLGGIIHMMYLPQWFWRGYWGSPALGPLTTGLGLDLISSDYEPGTYSDNGPGFDQYGGVKPVTWQYTNHALLNGREVDMNGTPLTLAELEDKWLGR